MTQACHMRAAAILGLAMVAGGWMPLVSQERPGASPAPPAARVAVAGPVVVVGDDPAPPPTPPPPPKPPAPPKPRASALEATVPERVPAESLVVVSVITTCADVIVEVYRDGSLFSSVPVEELIPAGGARRWVFTGKAASYAILVDASSPGRQRRWLRTDIGVSPTPPPGPGPPPPPPPPPLAKGAKFLIIEETDDRARLPRGQLEIITSQTMRRSIEAVASKTAGVPDVRVLDDDLRVTEQPWAGMLQSSRSSVPWLVICSGDQCQGMPLPANVQAMSDLLARFAP